MLRPSIKRIGSLKYPLIDNPFYDEKGKLIGENKLVELILEAENESNQNIFGGEFYIPIHSAVIFGSLTERYKRKKIRLNPNSDIDLFLQVENTLKEQIKIKYGSIEDHESFFLYSAFTIELINVLKEKYSSFRKNNILGLFFLKEIDIVISQKRLGEWEMDQGIGFYIESYYPLNLER